MPHIYLQNVPTTQPAPSDEPECPNCGADVDVVKSSVTGIETFTYQCQSCDWCSDPE